MAAMRREERQVARWQVGNTFAWDSFLMDKIFRRRNGKNSLQKCRLQRSHLMARRFLHSRPMARGALLRRTKISTTTMSCNGLQWVAEQNEVNRCVRNLARNMKIRWTSRPLNRYGCNGRFQNASIPNLSDYVPLRECFGFSQCA